MKGQQVQSTLVEPYNPDTGKGGDLKDFAADYPGVMVALCLGLLGWVGYFVKEKLKGRKET